MDSSWQNPSDEQIKNILLHAKNIAVVGCSPNPDKTSYQITQFLLTKGYKIFPVHPTADVILDQKVYANLVSIPEPISIVNVFRRPVFTSDIAKESAAIHAKTLWLQQGITNLEAGKVAHQHHMNCIMDRCIAVMHRLLIREGDIYAL